jgi:hypothetical protein
MVQSCKCRVIVKRFESKLSIEQMHSRAVFTIATGKPVYLEMAFALARSFRLWHRDSNIRFYLVTDASTANLPADLRDLNIIPIATGQYGSGFRTKLPRDVRRGFLLLVGITGYELPIAVTTL